MPKDFSFYAYVDPKPGLSRINVQDMEDPDRHKITPRPPIGYWFQRLHFFGYSTSIWNVKENWEPHRFNITRDAEQISWYQCYSFFAFDKLAPGLKLISIHERNDDAGCLRYKISRGGRTQDGIMLTVFMHLIIQLWEQPDFLYKLIAIQSDIESE